MPAADRRTSYPDTSPGFYELGQSLAAVWDVWLSTQAGAEHVQRLGQYRLQELVAFARQHAAFYRDLYRGIPLDGYRVTDLPVVSKSRLMEQFDAAVTDGRVTSALVRRFLADQGRAGHPLLDRYAVWTSSGTTGEPGVFMHDGRALAVYEALQAVRFRRLATPALFAAAFLRDDRYALVGATGGHFAGNATAQRLRLLHPWLAERVRIFSVLDPAATLTQQLNAYQPTLMATYPTAASLLAEEQRAGRLAIRPREVWTGGEGLSSAQRTQIAEAFGCEVRDDYGASEFMAIAWDCGHGALHVNADWALLEPVDAHHRPVPPGIASHTVLLTNLANRVQPLIRYDLGDSVTVLDRPCECGSRFPAIRVEGRCDEVLTLSDATGRGVKLLPLALTTVLEDEAGVYRFQLVQTGATALVLRLDPDVADAAPRCRRALGRFLKAQGLPDVDVEIEKTALRRHPVSGKLQRVVALRKQPGS
jgi:phenylacetate-coenzyme A ligase PaaK-like adenylate-forming protein